MVLPKNKQDFRNQRGRFYDIFYKKAIDFRDFIDLTLLLLIMSEKNGKKQKFNFIPNKKRFSKHLSVTLSL
jgi:hypothetical protein